MIQLVKDGRPAATIVVAADAPFAEQHAAEELQKYLQQMSGARLPIAHAPASEGPNVYVGLAAPTDGLDLSEEALSLDGYVIKTAGNDLILTGRKPCSACYAVYHLLENALGCGFFEEGDQVPHRPTVDVPALDETHKPRFAWRNYFTNMQVAYSGMRWWTWDEFKPWVDYLVKKRFNSASIGLGSIIPFAAAKLGITIEMSEWEKLRVELMRRVIAYARSLGIKKTFGVSPNAGASYGLPGFSPTPDGHQLKEFVRLYKEQKGCEIKTIPLDWCGMQNIVLDPTDPVTKEFLIATVQVYIEQFGTDHVYGMWTPTEESWAEDDLEKANEFTYATIMEMIDVIKTADPEAEIWSPRVCVDNPTAEGQARAVRDAGLPVHGDMFLNHAGRMYDFLRTDYYWGLPFTTGMCGQCGRETNPNGDIRAAIDNAKLLINNPRAKNCVGFTVSSETNHRNVMTMDLYAQLSWDPNLLDPEEYPKQWCARRYGDAAEALWPAVKVFSETIMAYFDSCMHNGPLYRKWDGTGLPGLTSGAVKRLIGLLPQLRFILETLLSEYERLKDSPMYRFDLIDIGRTYLAGIFNDRLGRARKALRAMDKDAFERHAAEAEDVMHFMAKFCSADPQFRLKTHDDWAARWPEIVPGYPNSETTWITFTALISKEHWRVLLDYMPDDYAEMVEHYFLPRVQLYLQKMRERIEAKQDISGRLVDRGSDVDLPSRIADWATPQGNAPWSAYGDTCEPELTAGDEDLAYELICAGTVSGQYDFYEGSLEPLVNELFDRYPMPDDIDAILAEPDHATIPKRRMPSGVPGQVMTGFRAPGVVEKAVVPPELKSLVDVDEIRSEYNIQRGQIHMYQVTVSGDLKVTRLPNEKSALDDHAVGVFEFEHEGARYLLRYDPGSQLNIANLTIERA